MIYLRDAPCRIPDGLRFLRDIPEKHVSMIDAMLMRNVNCFETSSCGRPFDAVASLIGLRQEVNFEGQAAIELEMIADSSVSERYPYSIIDGDPCQLDMRSMVDEIVRDISHNVSLGHIAARFHNTIAAMVIEVCERIRRQEKLERVCLSGGTFQNMYLLERAVTGLRQEAFEVYLHSVVPQNDGGISLGQAMIANEILRKA